MRPLSLNPDLRDGQHALALRSIEDTLTRKLREIEELVAHALGEDAVEHAALYAETVGLLRASQTSLVQAIERFEQEP